MRIAIVAGPYVSIPPQKYGGIEQVIHFLIKGLMEAGHEPILLGPGDSKVDCELRPIVPQALQFPTTQKEFKEHAKLVRQAEQVTARELRKLLPEIDLIHSHGFDLKNFSTFPHVITLHNTFELSDLDYFLQRKNLNYIAISQSQQTIFPELNYLGVVYNGEDPSAFPVVTEPKDYVCFLGRFDRDKNPHMAIQLALALGIKIKLAGKVDHNGEGYFEEEVAKYFNHPLVEYLGELNFEQKVELLSNARCNLHPTNFREPFGLTVLEAAYCGTPTMAVARGSMPELIEPGRTGLLVEDFLEGRTRIEECFAMDRNYIALRARELFNYRNMTEKYIKLYEQAIATTPAPSRTQSIFDQVIAQVDRLTKVVFKPSRLT